MKCMHCSHEVVMVKDGVVKHIRLISNQYGRKQVPVDKCRCGCSRPEVALKGFQEMALEKVMLDVGGQRLIRPPVE